jgi:hypothetical protein
MTFEWGRPKPELEPKPEQLDTAPVDWGAVTQSLISAAIAQERRFNEEALAAERRFNMSSWPGSSRKCAPWRMMIWSMPCAC